MHMHINERMQIHAQTQADKHTHARAHTHTHAQSHAHTGKEQLTGRQINERIQNTMQEMFWRKLVISLTPTAQSKREDFVVGSQVQA